MKSLFTSFSIKGLKPGFFTIILSIFFLNNLSAQVVIWSEDFSGYPDGTTDSPGNWTSTGTDCDDGGLNMGNEWGVFSGFNNGTFNCNDVEGAPCCGTGGGNDNHVETVPIDISNYCDVMVSVDFGANGNFECNSPANPIFDCNTSPNGHDQIYVEYELDGAAPVQGAYICGSTGLPGGGNLATFSFSIPSGNSLVVRIFMANKANGETYYADNWIIEGNLSSPVQLTNVQDTFCGDSPAYPIPTTQDGVTGGWSGTGVVGNTFLPSTVGPGTYTLTFTPAPPACNPSTDTTVTVLPAEDASWTPPAVCQSGGVVTLSPEPGASQNGTWSGNGVTDNGDGTASFDPAAPGAGTVTYSAGSGLCSDISTQTVPITSIAFTAFSGPFCDDNGTPSDPSDDFFTYEYTFDGTNIASTWTANDPNGTTGSYGVNTVFGPYPINGGAITFIVTDDGPLGCSTGSITLAPSSTCSPNCQLDPIQVLNVACNDGGTPSDPSDDFITFDLNPDGNNISSTYDVSVAPGSVTPTSGAYGSTMSFSMQAGSAGGGNVNVTVTDSADPNCSISASFVDPGSCSNACAISDAGLANIQCNDNNTGTDPSDDFITFTLDPMGANLGSSYDISVSPGSVSPTSGNYSAPTTFTMQAGSAGNGLIDLTLTDASDPGCVVFDFISDPGSCSNNCSLNANAGNVICDFNGTPSDSTDDVFFFDLFVIGMNTGSGWTADDPNNSSGPYGLPIMLGPYPISGGVLNFTVTDNNDPNCTFAITVTPPSTCSDQCDIATTTTNIFCDDNGTPSDPNDDIFTFELTVTGDNTATVWTADDPNNTSGNYDTPTPFGPYPVSGGNLSFTVTDNSDAGCVAAVNVNAPSTCSNQCTISATTANVLCNDNGTPSDPSDDTFTFDIIVTGSNTGTGWSADDPNNTSGSYDNTISFGPYPINGGTLNFTITDDNDNNCTASISVNPPATCSDQCAISASAANVLCDDNGTPSDPSDDTFTFEVTVTGNNTGAGWNADDPNNTTGSYDNATTFGPYPISGGALNFIISDDVDAGCTASVSVNPPATCSNQCAISASTANVLCDDNGTPSDPSDDTFTFEVTVTGSNTGAGWNADDPNNTTGSYDNATTFGPYPISGGALNFIISDDVDAGCTASVSVNPPATCSNQCAISASTANVLCDDNGTPSDPSDDTYTFEVTVTGSNTGAGWSADDPNNTTGSYDNATTFGPYPISGGALNFIISDDVDAGCTASVSVNPPATCSNQCVISASTANVLCDDNGTPSDPSDDTYTFEVTVTGSNTGAGWSADDPNNTTGSYDNATTFGPYPISGGALNFTISDDVDAGCNASVSVNPPATCSNQCVISASTANVLCDDNGTPSDPSDDTYTFEVTVTGNNTGAGWNADDPNNTTGSYDNATTFGPYPISGGALNFTISDDVDAGCNASVSVNPPATCSNQCVISASTTNVLCNDNGTPSDPSDDTFTFEITVSGSNTAAGWSADDPNNTTGTYGNAATFGPYAISGGTLNFTITDDIDNGCTASVSVTPPATCSNQCAISATTANVLCNDNGTPSDPSDDTFTFDITVTGSNTGTGWNANDPNNTTGNYDVATSFGPYPISGGALNFTVTDDTDSGCTASVSVTPPATCSDLCVISTTSANVLCDDNGTPSDPSDDTFTFELTVTGDNTGSGWSANDPNSTSGNYDTPTTFGPYPISGGTLNFTVTDDTDSGCTSSVMVAPPATCSDLCAISAITSNILCDDNGTPSDPSDDTFTFEIDVTGSNTGTGWTANDPNGTSGDYTSTAIFGPFPISGGTLSFTITDNSDANCTAAVSVDPPATCSNLCFINATVNNIACDDNGTPTDPADDTYTFILTVSGSNTGTSWSTDGPNSTAGVYDVPAIFGPYLISNGTLNFTVTDGNDPGCTTTVSVDPPTPCSGQCSISNTVANIACDNNGTPSDPSDDTFSFTVLVSGSNTGAGWSANDPNGVSGIYNVEIPFGPYPISGGDLSFAIIDDGDPNCATAVTVTAPASCSNECAISTSISNIFCNNNGTPSDPSDDIFTFDISVFGNNTSNGWNANDPNNTTGVYGTPVTFGPYPIASGNVQFTITDNNSVNCSASLSVQAPSTCSNQCSITADTSNVVCDDNGTTTDPSDDTFTFSLNVSGNNNGTSWTANDPNTTSGNYNTDVNLGPFPIIDGNVIIEITDDGDNNCTTSIEVEPPSTCSDECFIIALPSNVQCDDNGTATDETDDTFTFDLNVSGNAPSPSGWIADDPNTTIGTYDSTITFGPFPISSGNLTFNVVDNDDAACIATVFVSTPPTCSNQCTITADTSNISCDDNGTPFDLSDDQFFFDLVVTGSNTGGSWIANDAIGTAGTYGPVFTFGPYPVNTAPLTIVISDDANPGCEASITIDSTNLCPFECALNVSIDVINTSCGEDNGEASINISGGSGDYSIEWSNGVMDTNLITNLPTGPVSVTITDNISACTASAGTVVSFQEEPEIEWTANFGSPGADFIYKIINTSDGHFLAIGDVLSDGGDVNSHFGSNDIWVVKLDNQGNIIWEQNYGGAGTDIAADVVETPEGDYLIVGETDSNDGDVSNNNGLTDWWVLKIDANGNIIWANTYGGSMLERANTVHIADDGEYLVGGWTSSADGDVSLNKGLNDTWLVKMDEFGNIVWETTFGGTFNEEITDIESTPDGNYLFTGITQSSNGDVTNSFGLIDIWVVKFDPDGNLIWERSYGGTSDEYASDLLSTSDGSFLITGWSRSDNGNVNDNYGQGDIWVVKITQDGNIVWERNYGGSLEDNGFNALEANDGGFVISGFASSSDFDVNANQGQGDFWILKVDALGNLFWEESFGGSFGDFDTRVLATNDGGLLLSGTTISSDGDVVENNGLSDWWLVKLNQPAFPQINLGPDTSVCFGNNIQLAAQDSNCVGCTYQWNDGSMDSVLNITVNTDALYTLTVTDINGCTANDSVFVSVLPVDTIFLFETSCNPLDTGVTISVLTNQSGCDSTVILETTFQQSDSTFIFESSCNPADTGIVSQLFSNQFGCDSLVLTETNLLPEDSTFLLVSSCNPADTGITVVVLMNQLGCDSTVITQTDLLQSDSTLITAGSCNPIDTGITTAVFANQFGCDSVVVTVTNLLPSDSTLLFSSSCNPADTGISVLILNNQFGCDSTIITETSLLPSDSTFISASSCNPIDTGITSVLLSNQFGCDSVVITETNLLPSDSTFITATSCNPLDTGISVTVLNNQFGCDSTLVITTTLLPSDSTFLSAESCNPQDTGVVIESLTNQFGCDSTVITTTTLLPSDSTFLSMESCSPLDTGVVVEILNNQLGCDSTVITTTTLLPSDSTFLLAENCNPLDTGVSIETLVNQFGCDSTVVTTTVLLPSDSTSLSAASCNPLDTGVVVEVLTNQFGCDSTIITTTTLLPSDSTFLSAESCNPLDTGVTTVILTNQFGCDSTVVTNTNLLPSSLTLLSAESCNPQDTGIVIEVLTNQFGCDSTVITTTTLLPSDSTFLAAESCNPVDTGVVVELLNNQFGCDSTVITVTSLLPSDSTLVANESCNPLDTGVVIEILSNQFGCDSTVITTTTLLPSDSTSISAESCNPLDTGVMVEVLINQFGCDSTVITTTSLLPSDSIFFSETSCNPLDTGTVVEVLSNQFGCDSVVTTTTTLILPGVNFINTDICEGDTLIVNNIIITNDTTFTTIIDDAAASGCDSIINVDVEVLPNSFEFIEDEICEGEVYNFNGMLLTEAGIYMDTVDAPNGCDLIITLTLSVLSPSQEDLFLELCPGESIEINGTTYDENTPSGTETIVGQNGCDSLILTVNLTFTGLQVFISELPPSCFGDADGVIFIDSIQGGTPPYLLSVDGFTPFVISVFPFPVSNLEGGIYNILISDANACNYEEDVFLEEPAAIQVELGEDQTIILGDSIQIRAQTTVFDPLYTWFPLFNISCPDCPAPFVSPQQTTTYGVIVVDTFGCTAEDLITIFVESPRNVFIPNVFSPDGDGFNDKFFVNADLREVSIVRTMRIFDRWGDEVFNIDDFPPNDPSFGWDGTFKGDDVLPGVYVYYIEIEFADGRVESFKGGITVVR